MSVVLSGRAGRPCISISTNPTSAYPHPVEGCRTPPLHAHTQFKATSACPHPVQGCRTPPLHAHTQFKAVYCHLCLPIPSSRLSNFACQHHPVQGCPPQSLYVPTPQFRRTPPLHAHTQFKAVEPHLCMPTPSSRSACQHPVQGCPPQSLYAHTQFKIVAWYSF